MKKQFRFFFTHRQSKLLLRLYLGLKKLAFNTQRSDSSIESKGFEELVTRRKMDGYSFRNAEYTFGQLYHISKANTLKAKLNKFANKNGGGNYTFRLDTLNKAFSSDSAAYDLNIGSVQLKKSELSDMFTAVGFSIQIINSAYFMLYTSFYVNKKFDSTLNKARFQESITGRVGVSLIPSSKKFFLTFPTQRSYKSLYKEKISETENRITKYLNKYFDVPLIRVNTMITLYSTAQKVRTKIHNDFQHGSIGYFPLYFKDEILFDNEEKSGFHVFLKRENVAVEKGYSEYPNEAVRDFGAFMLFNALSEYVNQIENNSKKVVKLLAEHSTSNNISSLKKLRQYSTSLISNRYEVGSISSLINSPDWNVYIMWEKSENVAIARLRYYDGKKVDNITNFMNRLQSNIEATNRLITNATSRVDAELNVKNTASNNKLSRTVLWVSLVALLVAVSTIFINLYPQTTRDLICSNSLLCVEAVNETKQTIPAEIYLINLDLN